MTTRQQKEWAFMASVVGSIVWASLLSTIGPWYVPLLVGVVGFVGGCGLLARSKGHPTALFLLGLLGVFGLLIVGLLPDKNTNTSSVSQNDPFAEGPLVRCVAGILAGGISLLFMMAYQQTRLPGAIAMGIVTFVGSIILMSWGFWGNRRRPAHQVLRIVILYVLLFCFFGPVPLLGSDQKMCLFAVTLFLGIALTQLIFSMEQNSSGFDAEQKKISV